MTKAKIGAGNVAIVLDGEDVVLRPNLKAAQTISRQKGGIMAAVDAVGKFDFDTIAAVITLGLGVEGKEARDIPEKVYSTGMADLVAPVINYLSILANGGRPVSDDADGGDNENPQSR
ncbi:MAG: hypothetical protein KKF33_12535 [Alphaproteobacteria bacterium]|nr:hypothetical protein [Alphaproteobacteria bacterium]